MRLQETHPWRIQNSMLCENTAYESNAKTCAWSRRQARCLLYGATTRGGRAKRCLTGPAEEGRVRGSVRGCCVEQNGGLQDPSSWRAWRSWRMGRCRAVTVATTAQQKLRHISSHGSRHSIINSNYHSHRIHKHCHRSSHGTVVDTAAATAEAMAQQY